MTHLEFKYQPREPYETSRPVVLFNDGLPVFGMRCGIDGAKRLRDELDAIIAQHERETHAV